MLSLDNLGTLAQRTRSCLAGFNSLCGLLESPSNCLPGDQLRPFSIHDEFGRFKVWAGNIGALQHGPASLDERLQHAAHVRDQVLKNLLDLSTSLEQAISIASGERSQHAEPEVAELPTWELEHEFGSSASEPSTISDEESLYEDTSSPRTEIQYLYQAIVNSVTALFMLSIAIRSSAPRARYETSFSDSSFDDKYDIDHVWEKFPHARAKPWLIVRLGKAITARRQFFRYRRDHRARLASKMTTRKAELNVSRVESQTHGQADLETGQLQKKLQTDSRTEASSSQAPTAATPYVAPNLEESNEDAETIMSESSVTSSDGDGASTTLRIPPLPPESAKGSPFECPYCFTIQRIKEHDPTRWKRHLFRDLEPYVCTFRDCACKPFSNKHEWFSHELETHRNRWICSAMECKQELATRQAFEHHYRSSHAGTFTEVQLPSIVESCCRPVEMIPAKSCPLCNTWESRLRQRDPLNSAEPLLVSPKKFRNHLGAHLVQLAIYALPKIEKKSPGKDETASLFSKAAQYRALSNTGDESDIPQSQEAGVESLVHNDGRGESNIKASKEELPLYAAAKKGREELQRFMGNGGDLAETASDGATAIHQAAQDGNQEVLQVLHDTGANLDVMDKTSSTPLHRAAERNHLSTSRWLIERGADVDAVDKSGATALRRAAGKGCVDVMELLLDKGAEVDSKDLAGFTPLHRAAERGHERAVQLLLSHGAEVEPTGLDGNTPLHKAITRKQFEPVVHLLLQHGAQVDFKKLNGLTPLQDAAGKGRIDVTRFLLEAGADVNANGPRGIRAIHRAIYNKQFDIVEVLLEYGADVNLKDDDGWTALYATAAGGNLEVATLLLQRSQPDIEARDNSGFTALHRAADEGHSSMVELLASWNANINTTDNKGVTPVETARASGKVSTENILLALISSRH